MRPGFISFLLICFNKCGEHGTHLLTDCFKVVNPLKSLQGDTGEGRHNVHDDILFSASQGLEMIPKANPRIELDSD